MEVYRRGHDNYTYKVSEGGGGEKENNDFGRKSIVFVVDIVLGEGRNRGLLVECHQQRKKHYKKDIFFSFVFSTPK